MRKLTMEELGRPPVEDAQKIQRLPLTVILDNVRSALNVGSVFRSGDAFAVAQIVLTGITAQPPHRDILKTALGATETVPWRYAPSAAEVVQSLRAQGSRIVAVEQTDCSIPLQQFAPQPSVNYALVFGNEVRGIDESVLTHCDGSVEVPQFGTKHSINIAVCAGIVIWEFLRKARLG